MLTGKQGVQQNGSYSVIYRPGTQAGLWQCAEALSLKNGITAAFTLFNLFYQQTRAEKVLFAHLYTDRCAEE